jgi:hypothetical protein
MLWRNYVVLNLQLDSLCAPPSSKKINKHIPHPRWGYNPKKYRGLLALYNIF